ncbi:YeeE/YedE thiosulfate transporter family protein [Marivirga salinae]|uniref:YeeE/YedE thiosulfate transporter family protein n=1 Tax=Marivirga salinarum TaxID=3059078 RepID=A0AA49GDC9_9BACT|nr:DUF6691 family protein [Marivirga sp. BDSF4-3]WKK75027.1 YeeE/YedE thiosulfate transporter family protein [Marivirga sp. BDSF4-3]
MKFLRYLLIGTVFGITLAKAEVISWFRIYEMFKFQSFHMYGVIGSAIVVGIIVIQLIKRKKLKSIDGERIIIAPKQFSWSRYIIGGTIFGLGWAMTGACPGPMFILLGNGVGVILVVIASAVLGTYVYGKIRHKLPH